MHPHLEESEQSGQSSRFSPGARSHLHGLGGVVNGAEMKAAIGLRKRPDTDDPQPKAEPRAEHKADEGPAHTGGVVPDAVCPRVVDKTRLVHHKGSGC